MKGIRNASRWIRIGAAVGALGVAGPGVAQHVYRCIDWKGAVTYQSERCSPRDRIDRVYDGTAHIEIDGRAIRNFVPSASSSTSGLAPAYGQPHETDGRTKSDGLCGIAQAATRDRRHRTIESLTSDAALRSTHCNHARGPGG